MNRFFGTAKPAPPPPSLGDASQRMDSRVQALEQKIQQINQQLGECHRQLNQTKSPMVQKSIRERAMRLLKQKKHYEAQRDQLYGAQMNVDQAQFNMEMMKDTTLQVEAMQAAQASMQQQMKAFNINDIYKMQDQLEDSFDLQNEVQELLSRSYGVPEDIDETDLDAELEALQLEGDSSFIPSLSDLSADPAIASLEKELAGIGGFGGGQEKVAEKSGVDEYGLPAAPERAPAPWGL